MSTSSKQHHMISWITDVPQTEYWYYFELQISGPDVRIT